MTTHKIFYLFLATLIITGAFLGCNPEVSYSKLSSQQQKEIAIQKNDAAVKLFQQFMLINGSDSLFYQALDSVNTAIKYDSAYARAYHNKASMLAEVDSTKAAIRVLDQLVKIDSTQIMAITLQGFFYEQIGDSLKAHAKYLEAIVAYEQRIKNNPEDVNAKVERAFLFLFTDSKNKALKEINKVIQDHPESQAAIIRKESIQNFNRREFIKSQ